ncbi:hypothetical protein L7F22_003740 [Adiantum nelumboides]|nr:hypothetical protein [Adiantum nelumboides]
MYEEVLSSQRVFERDVKKAAFADKNRILARQVKDLKELINFLHLQLCKAHEHLKQRSMVTNMVCARRAQSELTVTTSTPTASTIEIPTQSIPTNISAGVSLPSQSFPDSQAAAVGGLLFRCEMCPNAYCEDDLPAEAELVGNCERFENLGQEPPSQAYFIHCCSYCGYLAKHQVNGIFEFPAGPMGLSSEADGDVKPDTKPSFQTLVGPFMDEQSPSPDDVKPKRNDWSHPLQTEQQVKQFQNLSEKKAFAAEEYESKPSMEALKGINGTRMKNEIVIID